MLSSPGGAGPEEALLLQLARTEPSPEAHARASAVLASGVDEDRLVRLAVAHGVAPLAYHGLRGLSSEASVPEEVVGRLQPHFLAQHRVGARLGRALPDLLDRFAARGIEALTFKGPVLAEVAYGRAALRPFTDLDLLVRKDDVHRAIALLYDAGFEEENPLPPDFDSHWRTYLPVHHPHGNANGYVRDDGLAVDLHWGLASHYFLFPMNPDELWPRRVPVALEDGTEVETFSMEDTLLHLCVHATKHRWERLSFVCDIAELLRACPGMDWPRLFAAVQRLRCERMLLVGLHAAHTLLDAPLPPPVRARAAERPEVAALSEEITRLLFRSQTGFRALFRRGLFQLRIRDRLRDGLGACYHELRLVLTPTREDRAWLPLPRALSFLYLVLRPIRVLSRSLRRAFHSAGASDAETP